MRRLATAIVAAALGSLLAGAAQATDLRIGLQDDPGSLDPLSSNTFVSRQVLEAVCDKLVDIDTSGQVVPMLATSWDWSADSKVLTFKLRDKVVFHDGEAFNAQAVQINLDRYLKTPDSRRGPEINVIDHTEVVDDHTIRLVLKQPSIPLLTQLTDRAGIIISPKAIATNAAGLASKPICAGPYMLAEYKVQDQITVQRFPQHWRADQYHFDRVVFRDITDNNVRMLNLRSGQLDLVERISTQDMLAAKTDTSFKVAVGAQPAYQYLQFNLSGPKANPDFATKPALRQALSMAVDRIAINDVAFDGLYDAGNQPFPPSSPWFDPDYPVKAPDLAAVRAKMKEAGVEHAKLDLLVPTDPDRQKVAQILQVNLAEVGIELNILPTEFVTLLAKGKAGDFQALFVGSAGRVDPDLNISLAVGCGQANNVGKYCNADLDALLAQARAIADPAERKSLYRKAIDILVRDVPLVYLFNPKAAFGLRTGVTGFEAFPDGVIRLENVSLKP